MFDKSKQSDDILPNRIKEEQKINKKKQKEVVPSKPTLKTSQILGNGLKKGRRRYKKHVTKRKIEIAEKNSNVNSPPEAENVNHKKKKKNRNKTANVTNGFSTEISVKSSSQGDCHEAKEGIGSDLLLKHETEISEHSSSKKRKHDDTEIQNKRKKKSNSDDSENKIQNYDIDKLDQVILDVKKKKYDAKFKNDDIEDILFRESIDDSKESKQNKKSKKFNEVVNEKTENGHENDVSKTKKKKKYGNKSNGIEDILFCESIDDSKESKQNTKSKKCNEVVNEKTENGHENDVSKTKKKKKYGNKSNSIEDIRFCENIADSKESKKNKKSKKCNEVVNEKTENGHENDVSKTKKKKKYGNKSNDSEITNGKEENNVDKESVTNIKDTKMKPKVRDNQKRKDKIRKLLELVNRNNIKASSNNLRDRMLERLKAAKFRYLNEKLYTSSGLEAQELFQSDPEAFQTYHEGYQQQLKKWPINPLDLIIKKIEKMPKSRVIADMGCGTAALAARVQQTVHSFDLVASAAGVHACDMAHTPLLAGSVDVAVYCLALMGTQLTQYLLEANRILKQGGTLLIAEVESRFTDAEAFARALSRLGFQLRQLERHRVFLLLELSKAGTPRRGRQPELTLKPCLYKKR